MNKKICIKNPNNLLTIDYHKLKILQGDLKTLSKENLKKLCNSIKRYGYFIPAFVWRTNTDLWILDATQRFHALEQLENEGYKIPEIPYIEIEAKDRNDAAEKLLQITSRYGEINPKTTFLKDFDIDISFINDIEIPELDIKLDELVLETVEDEVPELPPESLSKTGDLWLCGNHRVLCGDATNEADIQKLMGDKKADMCFCDPPYNIGLKYEKYDDNKSAENYCNFIKQSMYNLKSISHLGASIYIMSGEKFLDLVQREFKHFFRYSQNLIWVKPTSNLSNYDYQYNHESIIYGWVDGKSHKFYGDKQEKTVIEVNRDLGAKAVNHPAQRPIVLLTFFIHNSSLENDIIADFFLGSGTTLIAAEQLNRVCYGVEIDPRYVDVILDRWVNLTNEDPIRESDNVKWSELQSGSRKRIDLEKG